MARFKPTRRVGPIGTAMMLWQLWHRLPKRQRRWVLAQARNHGPTVVRRVYTARRRPKP